VLPPAGGTFEVGGLMVYVNTYCTVLPVQSVYVHVYVLIPEQTGSGLTTGPVIVAGVPQELFTVGGVGTVWALLIQETVVPPGAGAEIVGGEIV
jgi:hypothetical protein